MHGDEDFKRDLQEDIDFQVRKRKAENEKRYEEELLNEQSRINRK